MNPGKKRTYSGSIGLKVQEILANLQQQKADRGGWGQDGVRGGGGRTDYKDVDLFITLILWWWFQGWIL